MLKESNVIVSNIVVFMTAYHFPEITVQKKKRLLRRKKDSATKLKEHHLEAVFSNDVVVSQFGRMDFTTNFDSIEQKTTLTFSEEELQKESHNKIWNQMLWAFRLKNEMTALFDTDVLKPSFFYRLEPFRVSLRGKTMDVTPVAYMLESTLCTAFVLYDCDNKKYICAKDVCGRSNHYHLLETDRVCYNGKEWQNIEKASISHIISENVGKFNLDVLNVNFIQKGFAYYHSMLIMSNSIANHEEYAKDVVGTDILSMPLNNISPSNECLYFSQECFAIVSDYTEENSIHLLFRHIALESLKIFYFINLIASYEQTFSLADTYHQVLNMDILEHMMNVPVLTIEALNNIRKMSSYAKWKEAISFKIAYMNTQQEKRKNENATLLNLLLYILTLVSTLGTVYDLAKEFCWPIPLVLSIVLVVFVVLGGLWYAREHSKK